MNVRLTLLLSVPVWWLSTAIFWQIKVSSWNKSVKPILSFFLWHHFVIVEIRVKFGFVSTFNELCIICHFYGFVVFYIFCHDLSLLIIQYREQWCFELLLAMAAASVFPPDRSNRRQEAKAVHTLFIFYCITWMSLKKTFWRLLWYFMQCSRKYMLEFDILLHGWSFGVHFYLFIFILYLFSSFQQKDICRTFIEAQLFQFFLSVTFDHVLNKKDTNFYTRPLISFNKWSKKYFFIAI